MHPRPIGGYPVCSPVLLIGQAPGVKEPELGRPFAWTAGKTLFKWLNSISGLTEEEIRRAIYFAAVCRCFPGKNPKGGDRVPAPDEIDRCAQWLNAEFRILKPRLVIAVGKLAAARFLQFERLTEIIGKSFSIETEGGTTSLIALPHPSGASTWHRMEPGKTLTLKALDLIAGHPAYQEALRKAKSAEA